MKNTQPLLEPIEKPKGFLMKLVYYLTRKRLGKVITPVKVISARLPFSFGMFAAKTYQLDNKLKLKKETAILIRNQVSRINICEFCIDAGRLNAINESLSIEKFDAISNYKTSKLFNEAEKAALDYATELTKFKKVNPLTFSTLLKNYSEREICEIVFLIASEHMSNISNLGLNIHSDLLCDITLKKNTDNIK